MGEGVHEGLWECEEWLAMHLLMTIGVQLW